MGEINIEGLGIVEIKGDVPDEAEQNAIIDAIGDPEDEGDANITFQEDSTEITSEPIEQPEAIEGPLGIVPTEERGAVRKAVEDQPGLVQLLAEVGPSVGGALGGAALGAPFFPPFGAIGGAVVGGLAGETVAQETGLAPNSDLNLILSAAGPVVGKAFGGLLRGSRALTGKAITGFPFSKAAHARNQMSSAVSEFESLGTRIIEKQKGIIAKPSSELYDAVRRSGVIVPPKALKNTRDSIRALLDEMKATKAFPEVSQAMKVLKQTWSTLGKSNDISMDTLVLTRQLLGAAVRRAQSAGGIKLGKAKQAFKAISEDLDKIATDPSLTGRAARTAKAATKRAKLEFSVKDLEAGVARFVKDAPTKDGAIINIPGLQKWFRNVTNPKSTQFNKNFTDALKDEIPAIKERLVSLAKITGAGNSAGPGSLVVRGRLAKAGSTVIGGLLGFGSAGPIGAGVGAVAGANVPEMMTSLLMTKTGSAFLNRAARLGKGQISERAWNAAGQIITRSVGEGDEISSRTPAAL